MPWRGETDPYKIWLSEVMLQQTQVETVIPYYKRWLKKYPTIQHVARSKVDSVLKSWEGLGYYSRARNFKKACVEIVSLHGGKVPKDKETFSKLKGVGPYTLAAVHSIAFHKPIPTIDGNVKRVVSRLQRISTPIVKAQGQIETYLNGLMCRRSPGDFNQAMMDLGATICKPKNQLCLICPVSKYCDAFKHKDVDKYPVLVKKPHRPHYKIAVGIIWKGDKILVSKRKAKGLLGGLWEFPGGKIEKGEKPEHCVKREVKEEIGIDVEPIESVGVVKHAFTHFTIEMEGFLCKYKKGKARRIACDDVKWIRFNEMRKYAFPKSNHKLFPLLPSENPFHMR